ncbi:MAG: GGDEF domain-containing protein, partial [Mariprofundaceae bacterium]
SHNRKGEMQFFPFSSLSIGALPCTKGRFTSSLEISASVFELKHKAKKISGNSLVIDQRSS